MVSTTSTTTTAATTTFAAFSLANALDIAVSLPLLLFTALGFFSSLLSFNLVPIVSPQIRESAKGHAYFLLYQFQFLRLQQLFRYSLRIALGAQTQEPELFAKLRGVLVEEAGKLNLQQFDIRLSQMGQTIMGEILEHRCHRQNVNLRAG